MAALEQTHYTLDSTSNGPPRGWLNLRTRGLPFSAWTRQFFFIQDCHLMCQAKEDVNANIFLDFKGAIVKVLQKRLLCFLNLKKGLHRRRPG